MDLVDPGLVLVAVKLDGVSDPPSVRRPVGLRGELRPGRVGDLPIPVPSGLIVKIAPYVWSALKYRRNAIRPFFPGAVA